MFLLDKPQVHSCIDCIVLYKNEYGTLYLCYYMYIISKLSSIVLMSLYSGDVNETLSWDLRVQVALDVARGLEYLHDGVISHVICANLILHYILL